MSNRRSLRLVVLAAMNVFFVANAIAQFDEFEPNNPCEQAQYIGYLGVLPALVNGELPQDYNLDPSGDVDFYIFEAPEGLALRARLVSATSNTGTIIDPYLGLFDSECNLLAANDDYLGLNSRIDFAVPAGGMFILAATGCCDAAFEGMHGQDGSYTLRVTEQPVPVPAITGRLVDAVSGDPLPGNLPPYPWVELILCRIDGCIQTVSSQAPNEDGVFRFETDSYGNPLSPLTYVVRAWAGEYSPAETEPFPTFSAEISDLGDLALEPPPFVFSQIKACSDLVKSGGRCTYSVDVRNNTRSAVHGLGWSMVNTWGGTSLLGYSLFQADSPRNLRIAARSAGTLRFRFDVPSGVADGTVMCADAWFSDKATEYFGTLRSQPLFCVMKQAGVMKVLDSKEAAARLGVRNVNSWERGVKGAH
jgi:hypothetical protein